MDALQVETYILSNGKGWDDVCWMKTVVEKKDTKTFAPIIILL